jgi:hypothetical protein
MGEYLDTSNPVLVQGTIVDDSRGRLISLESLGSLISIKRSFTITSSEDSLVRGGHAHKKCLQLIYPIFHNLEVVFKNKHDSGMVLLSVGEGLIVPPYNWIEIKFFKAMDCAVVLASENYSKSDYLYEKP